MDYQNLRDTMVQRQIKPYGVHRNDVLDIFRHAPREYFLPQKYQQYAYADETFVLTNNSTQCMLPTKFIAKIIQEVLEQSPLSKNVLEVGTGSGYTTYLLSKCFEKVTTLEIDNHLYQMAKEKLQSLGLEHIKCLQSDFFSFIKDKEKLHRFDCIISELTAPQLPSALVDFVKSGKCVLMFIQTQPQLATATLFYLESNKMKTKPLFETPCPPCIGAAKEKSFVF